MLFRKREAEYSLNSKLVKRKKAVYRELDIYGSRLCWILLHCSAEGSYPYPDRRNSVGLGDLWLSVTAFAIDGSEKPFLCIGSQLEGSTLHLENFWEFIS